MPNFSQIGQFLEPAACPKVFGLIDRYIDIGQILGQLKLRIFKFIELFNENLLQLRFDNLRLANHEYPIQNVFQHENQIDVHILLQHL